MEKRLLRGAQKPKDKLFAPAGVTMRDQIWGSNLPIRKCDRLLRTGRRARFAVFPQYVCKRRQENAAPMCTVYTSDNAWALFPAGGG